MSSTQALFNAAGQFSNLNAQLTALSAQQTTSALPSTLQQTTAFQSLQTIEQLSNALSQVAPGLSASQTSQLVQGTAASLAQLAQTGVSVDSPDFVTKFIAKLPNKALFAAFGVEPKGYAEIVKGIYMDSKFNTDVLIAVAGQGDGRISKDDAKALFLSVMDGFTYSDAEKGSMDFIRNSKLMTGSAKAFWNHAMSVWAGTRGVYGETALAAYKTMEKLGLMNVVPASVAVYFEGTEFYAPITAAQSAGQVSAAQGIN